jgi:glycosyltransferase involved in cell wall biosynthesis
LPDIFLSIVIPAFNEERRLPETLGKALAWLAQQPYASEIIVADDGSADGTAKVAEGFAGGAIPVTVLRLPHRGKGHAVRQGMLAAAGRHRFQCDADLAMPIEQVTRFLPPALQGVAIAAGSREAPGAKRYGEPWHRHLMGRIFNGIIRLIAVPKIPDTQCGFKCYGAEAAQQLFSRQRLDGFAFDVEVLFIAGKLGLSVKEVPIDWHHNQDSRVRPVRDTFSMLCDLLRIRINNLQGRYRIK